MTAGQRGRLLVALEAAEDSLALIETATRLAAALERELVGLLVADPGLAAAAALPFTRLQPLRGADPTQFDRPDMDRALRAFTRLAERRLAAACARRSVRWSLTVATGRTPLPPGEGDLLVVGPRPPPGELVTAPACPIVILRPRGRSVLLVDAGDAGLLALASRTAARERLPLVIVLWGAEARPGRTADPETARCELVHVREGDALGLATAIRHHAPAILFLDACRSGPELAVVLAALRGAPDQSADYSGATG